MATIVTSMPGLAMRQAPQRISKMLLIAVAFYCASLIKFFVRDPLAKETGPQGPIELLLVMAAGLILLAAARRFHQKPVFTTAAKTFLLFGVLAAFSSIFSFDPRLSALKALAFFVVCAIAIMAASAYPPLHILKCFYYSVTVALIAGSILRLVSGDPLFEMDEYSGRARFTIFAWDPGTLADLSALALLISTLLPRRPPLYLQIFLFALNVAAGARTSTALLILVLLWQMLAAVRITPRTVITWCGVGFLITLIVGFALQIQQQLYPELASALESLYGVKTGEDVRSLNGRAEVWQVAAPLLPGCFVLGYGLEGAREALVSNTSWGAGHSHNSILELVLSAGFPGAFLFLVGWGASAKRAWKAPKSVRNPILGLYAYMVAFGMVEPNLTYLQGLAVFLIITLDTALYTGSLRRDVLGASLPLNS